jgi:DNA ligase-1
MKNILNRLQELVTKLQSDSSSNKKVELLKEYLHNSDLKKLVMYIHNPFYQFHVTSDNCKKLNTLLDLSEYEYNIFELLDDLRNREITGHNAIGVVNSFIKSNIEHKELIFNIIDKDLKCRIGESLINKAVPGTVPTFDVALAEKFEPEMVNFETESWFVSRKLDGVRCITVIDENGKVTCFSRQGKIFNTLDKVEESLKQLNFSNIVFDGEICMVDKNGDEDFQSIMKEIRKKNHRIENVKYKIFDMLTLEEFNTKVSKRKLSTRLEVLSNNFVAFEQVLVNKAPHLLGVCEILPQEKLENIKHFQKWLDEADNKGWEGVMVRKDDFYKGKRSKDLLKAKKFYDAEYVVKDINYGPIRIVVEGKEVTETMTSQIVIEHKGYDVSVGSGFSLDQRKEFFKDASKIVGKTVTIQFFEETQNQEGGVSLRFPVLKHVYENGRDV